MSNKGIDYSLGQSNVNKETGIHYGVISQNSVTPDCLDSVDYDYGKPTCPECSGPVVESSDTSMTDEEWNEGMDYACKECKQVFWSDRCFADEPNGWSYDSEGYKLTDCLNNDIFVLESPYYTFAQFCSPCVPGAGNLDTPVADGAKTYCLGHDWFDGDAAPYPVYLVATGIEVKPAIRLHCDQCQMLSINGVACHETECPNMGARFDADSDTWIKQRECGECGCAVDADDLCCNAPQESEPEETEE